MSGLVKGVKKVFKTVAKVAKKILPYALPIAAAVFTVGGFLGVPAMAGGWGGAVGKLFGQGLLGKVVGGAITQAGYGGLIGGGIGLATGGKKGLKKGSLYGQAIGAATGAVTGAISYAGNPAARAATTGTQQGSMPQGGAAPGQQGLSSGLDRSTSVMRGYGSDLPGQYGGAVGSSRAMVPAAAGMAQTQAAQGVTSAAQQLPSAAMVPGAAAAQQGAGWWAQQDPIVQASMITSGAMGLQAGIPAIVGAFSGKDDEERNMGLETEKYRTENIAKNYAGFKSPTPPPSTAQPLRLTQRYEYDQNQGRIVLKYA